MLRSIRSPPSRSAARRSHPLPRLRRADAKDAVLARLHQGHDLGLGRQPRRIRLARRRRFDEKTRRRPARNWVCIAFAPNMKTFDTPEIKFADDNPEHGHRRRNPPRHRTRPRNGLKVIFKPVVNSVDNVWRAWIRFFRPVTDDEQAQGITGEWTPGANKPDERDGMVRDIEKWDQWWNDYTDYIVHYAKIAEELQVPVLCLGCEMNSTEEFDDQWRQADRRGPRRLSWAHHVRRQSRQRRESQVVRRPSTSSASAPTTRFPFADGRPLKTPNRPRRRPSPRSSPP